MDRQLTKFEKNRVFDFIHPYTIRVNSGLAKEIGLNESIVFLQLEFLLAIGGKDIDGKHWVYESITDLQDYLGFLSRTTINRAIKSLIEKKLIHIANYNKAKYDKTRWFAFNYEEIANLQSVQIRQKGKGSAQNGKGSDQYKPQYKQNGTSSNQNGTTIPENSIKTSSQTSNNFENSTERETKLLSEAIEKIANHNQSNDDYDDYDNDSDPFAD